MRVNKAVILAAGEGTRLRPYTNDRPKCLVEVGEKSLLDRQLAVLRSEDITQITLVGGYNSSALKQVTDTRLVVNKDYASSNMIWSLMCAEDQLYEGAIISYGDIVYSKKCLQDLLNCKSDIAVAIDTNWLQYWTARSDNPLSDLETLKLHPGTQLISDIGQTPGSIDEIEGQYMGVIKLSKSGAKTFMLALERARGTGFIGAKALRNAFMTDLLQELVVSGANIEAVLVYDEWVEIDTTNDLESESTLERLSKIDVL